MSALDLRTREGETVRVDQASADALAASIRGTVLTPAHPGYEGARAVWNGMIERRPGLIVRCAGTSDVLAAVRFAVERDLMVAVRGAGHNIAGLGVCDGGLLVDLSGMRAVHVNPAQQTARVEPGCTLADFDREAQVFGLATPLGINSTTGVAGLTLGGGFGWLTRRYGYTVDNLLSADVVTAEGSVVRASPTENEGLFWALRGGGGNFGIVTSFEFRLHPVGPELISGLIIHPLAAASDVLRQWRSFAENAPDEVSAWVVLRKAPPLPFLDPSVHGSDVLVIAACHTGPMRVAEHELQPLRRIGQPIADVIGPQTYAAWQQAFDPLLTPGARNYWKTHDFETLDDALLDRLVDAARHLPSPQCEVFLAQLGGAGARLPLDATAFAGRRARYVMNAHARWEAPTDDMPCIDWARTIFEAAAPFATGGGYVNFLTQEEGRRLHATYGPNYERLAEMKAKWDPDNLFRHNHNIAPAMPVRGRSERPRMLN